MGLSRFPIKSPFFAAASFSEKKEGENPTTVICATRRFIRWYEGCTDHKTNPRPWEGFRMAF